MRVWSRLPLVLTVIVAAIGLGVPARGSQVSGVRAQHSGQAVSAGVAGRKAASLQFPVTVSVSPNPTEATLITSVIVATMANVSCTLSLRLPDQSVVQNVATVGADNNGNAIFQFTAGYNMIGQDTATVICSNALTGDTGMGSATFTVLPSVTTPTATPVFTAPGAEQVAISPNTTLVPGSIFSLVGSGFAPGATITFVGFILSKVYSAVVQANGTFVIPNIMVPYTQSPGTFTSALRNSANPFDRALVSYIVAALAPTVALDTASAAHGDTVGVSGSGFGGNEVVDVSIGPITLFTVQTDNTGNFSGTFAVPSGVPFGTFNVAARGESTAALGYAPLTITLISPFAPTSTVTSTATPVPPRATPGPPTFTPTSTPVPVGPTRATFYLPEGSTASGEQVIYTVLNTSTTPANVTLELVFADGMVRSTTFLVPAQSLAQTNANRLIGLGEQGQAFSAQVSADQPISVSRTILRDGQDGSLSNGTTRNYHYQYFAEGYTGRGFHESLALFNSANANANVELRLLPSTGAPPIIRKYIVGPMRRYTIDVNALAPRLSVGAIVISDIELSVERRLTFGRGGNGLTTVAGADAPQTTWYFAEGSTKNGFSEFLTLLNPTLGSATITADFFDPRGKRIGRKVVVVAARSRATIDVGSIVRATSVAAIVTSSTPVLAERTMYRGSLTGPAVIGIGSFGRSTLAPAYEFPSGDTSAGDAEFLLLLNPTAAPLAIQIRAYTAAGAGAPFTTIVPAHSRITINVGRDVPGIPPGPHGLVVSSVGGTPFMAEQSEYLHGFTAAWSSTGVARSAAG